ncbi:conserved hypothetical protein [Trichinella spiralis]|uniref:hypothetical protein n=1 Tax=Trichinella spiralis TaxID=6334 RepID=UPI0001EFC716|nr:conserved hypothetical protein [Trichinella spiralis]
MDFEALIKNKSHSKLQLLNSDKNRYLEYPNSYGKITDDNEDLIPSIIVDSVQSLQLEQLPFKKTKVQLCVHEVKFDGERYVVKPPWKTPEVRIPNNYGQAEQRLQQLEKMLNYNNERAKEYNEVIKNYMERGWIEETKEKDGIAGKTWYLPHHAVYRDDKTSTRCRIVFDASASYHGPSLNDFLESGPHIQKQILDILIRF